ETAARECRARSALGWPVLCQWHSRAWIAQTATTLATQKRSIGGFSMRMRLKKGLAGATFLVLGVGSASNAFAQLQLRGSDTLEDVPKDALTAANLNAVITYLGGGSGAGEAAMVGGTQHIAPMSREIGAALCTAASQQLLIGLDGIAVVAGS